MKATRNQLAMLRSLRTDKGRRETGLFLVEGARLVAELLSAKLEIECLAASEEGLLKPELAALVARFKAEGVSILEAPAHAVERISDTVHSQGILAAARWTDIAPDRICGGDSCVVVALDGVSDPGNVGTVIRTTAWFGVSAVLLGEGCADLLNPKVVRATMGGMFHVPVCRGVALGAALSEMKRRGFRVTAATMDGDADWSGWAGKGKSLLVLGGEARGVSGELLALADRRVTIPRRGKGDSLNVAVCAGILLAAASSAPATGR